MLAKQILYIGLLLFIYFLYFITIIGTLLVS